MNVYPRRAIREVEAARGPRCPDCGRRWPISEVEAAFRHVRAGCRIAALAEPGHCADGLRAIGHGRAA